MERLEAADCTDKRSFLRSSPADHFPLAARFSACGNQVAYAITIHKSQGSEFPVVVTPLAMRQYLLLQRNLIYTGITRVKKLVVLIGQRKAMAMAVRNNRTEVVRDYAHVPASTGPRSSERGMVKKGEQALQVWTLQRGRAQVSAECTPSTPRGRSA